MSEEISADIMRVAGEHCRRWGAGLREHEMVARAILAERQRCAKVAYSEPSYIAGFETGEQGRLKPGSPYDRGRYDAAQAILKGGPG